MVLSFYLLRMRHDTGSKTILMVFFVIMFFIIVYFALKMLEMAFVIKNRKPFYVHFYPFRKTLSEEAKIILKRDVPFYNKLSPKHKLYFEHRLAAFIKDKDFIGRKIVSVTEEMKVLISATAVMLTFGFRGFYIGLLSKIVIYPEAFYSNTSQSYKKSEFNPKLKAIVLSWKDFKSDLKRETTNHYVYEFARAIHLSSMKDRDVSSTLFTDSFNELILLLQKKPSLKEKLKTSKYFKEHIYNNPIEFLAVLIEKFIEMPQELKSEFPEVYHKTKQMLNFNYAEY